MRTKFPHMIPLTDVEMKHIWDEGVVTVDANVILSLYRFSPETRDGLMKALQMYRGRLWISHQAAYEFLRNRNGVANSVVDDLKTAAESIDVLIKSNNKLVSDLSGVRPVPTSVVKNLKGSVNTAISALSEAKKQIDELRGTYPDHVEESRILDDVLSLFDGNTGEPPSDSEKEELHKEAARRNKEKIPPGYKDANKLGDAAFGDYILWSQVLQYAKSKGRPVILVTAEEKEDWWEKRLGRIVGPRLELLEESLREAKQHIYICHLRTFVEHSNRALGSTLSKSSLQEMRALEPSLNRQDSSVVDLIRASIESVAASLPEEEGRVNGLIAETNADGYYLDSVDVISYDSIDYVDCTIRFVVDLYYTGEQREDRIMCGDTVMARMSGEIAFENGDWIVSSYEVLDASIKSFEDEDEE